MADCLIGLPPVLSAVPRSHTLTLVTAQQWLVRLHNWLHTTPPAAHTPAPTRPPDAVIALLTPAPRPVLSPQLLISKVSEAEFLNKCQKHAGKRQTLRVGGSSTPGAHGLHAGS